MIASRWCLFVQFAVFVQLQRNVVGQETSTSTGRPPDDKREPPTFPTTQRTNSQTLTDSGTSTTSKTPSYEEMRRQLLDSVIDNNDDELKNIRETHINALHDAIDSELIDPSFIQTLASVSQVPKVQGVSRDVLAIRSIVEDLNFTLGDQVLQWKTLSQKNDLQHVIVGLTKQGIVVIRDDAGVFTVRQQISLDAPPHAFDVMTLWDTESTSAVGCVVVSLGNFLVWYTMRKEVEYTLREEWRWPLHKTTTLIRFLRQNNVDSLLLIGTHPNVQQSISVTIYEFSFNAKQFWLTQKMGLSDPCESVGLVPAGEEFLVAFPQNNTAMIYAFRIGDQNRRQFRLVGNYSSEYMRSVDAFQMGRYSYVAISGKSPAILRYKNGRFIAQKIPTEALEIVEEFFEIPARTYRDDMILVVQHRMIFSTHEVQRLEALIWNGKSFKLVTNIPCLVENEVVDNDMSCVLDIDRTDGLFGAAIIQRSKQISLIVPRHDAHSSLFHVNIELLPGEHPILMKIQEMQETIEAFTKIVDHQNEVIKKAQNFIAKRTSNPIVLEDLKLREVYADEVHLTEDFDLSKTILQIGDTIWSEEDLSIDLHETVKMVQETEALVDATLEELKYAVPKDGNHSDLYITEPITVDGKVTIDGKLTTDELYVRRFVDSSDGSRTARSAHRIPELHVRDLRVEHLNFETYNGIPASDFVFIEDGKVELDGELIIDGDLHVNNVILPDGGTVNGVDLSENLVYFNCKNRRWKNLTFDSLQVLDDVYIEKTINDDVIDLKKARKALDEAVGEHGTVLRAESVIIEGDLHFERINGVPWQQFLDSFVWQNRPVYLKELHVENITFENGLNIQHMNGEAFPDGYVLKRGPRESIITGVKRFLGTLTTDAVDVDGTINGTNPFDLISLHDDQHIPGNVTIRKLVIEDSLDVRGEILSPQMENLYKSPTLKESKVIDASCEFRELIVDGPVYIEQWNGYDVDATYADIVYSDEQHVEINSTKHFNSLEAKLPVTVASNMISDVHIDEFLTKSTDQVVNISHIMGDVYFNRIELSGLFGGINVTYIDQNSLKLYGDQYSDATLEFCPGQQLLYAENLEILDTLNGYKRSEYFDLDEEIVLRDLEVHMSKAQIKSMYVENSVIDGPHKTFNDIHLPTFVAKRLSKSEPQHFDQNIYLNRLYVGQSLTTNYLNGEDVRDLKDLVDRYMSIDDVIRSGRTIDTLHIESDAEIGVLNGINLTHFLNDVIWLDRPNYIPGTVLFKKPLHIQGNLSIDGLLNGLHLNALLDGAVYRKSGVVDFYGAKLFEKGFDISGDFNTEVLNNIPVKNFILRNQTVRLSGDVVSTGKLYVENLIVTDTFNGVPMKPLMNYYQYDNLTDTHVVNGDLYLEGQQSIQHCDVESWNDISNLTQFLASQIRMDQDYHFKNHIVFHEPVHFEQGFNVDFVNGVNVSNIHNEIIYIDQEEPVVISDRVEFFAEVRGKHALIEADIIGNNSFGINPDELARTTLLINRNYEIHEKVLFHPGSIEVDHLQLDYVNGISTSELITIHTNQTINDPVYIDEMTIYQPLEVYGTVNGYDLRKERANTLMTYGEQHITIPTVFNNIRVLNNVTLPAIINDKPFGKPVELAPEMTISSPLLIRKLKTKELYTNDLISGINFDKLYENTLWKDGRDHQTIKGNIRTKKLIFRGVVEGNGTLNNQTIDQLASKLRARKQEVEDELDSMRQQFRSACHETQRAIKETQQQIYYFNYFVQRQTINEHRNIESFKFFMYNSSYFMALNLGCWSKFYQWNPVKKVFVSLFEAHTGYVYQWETLEGDDNAVYLVTRSAPSQEFCNVTGVHVWQFKGLSLEVQLSLPDLDVDSIRSNVNGVDQFYILNRTTVLQYDLKGQVLEQWNLSRVFESAEFLPVSIGLGLALSDGKRLVVLSTENIKHQESTIRKKRSNLDRKTQSALFVSPAHLYMPMLENYSQKQENAQVTESDMALIQLETVEDTNKLPTSNDPIIRTKIPVPIRIKRKSQQPEERIAKEVLPFSRIRTTENGNFPDPATGGIVTMHVSRDGTDRQQLVAVAEVLHTVIRGNNDAIKIYSDIVEGELYQILPCFKPSLLTVLEIRDETILAFVEGPRKVQLYLHKTVSGFEHWNSFTLASPVVQMTAVQLPQEMFFRCKQHYLVIALTSQELMFLKAKTQGDCGMHLELDCSVV